MGKGGIVASEWLRSYLCWLGISKMRLDGREEPAATKHREATTWRRAAVCDILDSSVVHST